MLVRMLMLLSISIMLTGTALANEGEGKMDSVSHAGHIHEEQGGANDGDRQIPEQVTSEHWAYRKITDLAQKYAVEKKLPEGKPCSKVDMAECFLAVMVKIVEKHEKEGAQAIRRDELESIAPLHAALEGELTQLEGYPLRREGHRRNSCPDRARSAGIRV